MKDNTISRIALRSFPGFDSSFDRINKNLFLPGRCRGSSFGPQELIGSWLYFFVARIGVHSMIFVGLVYIRGKVIEE